MEEQAVIFDAGIRPAIAQLLPENVQNWPATHHDAVWRARNHQRGLQYGTIPVPNWLVEDLGPAIRERLEGQHPWTQDMVFMVQMKGVKEATRHNPTVAMAAQQLDQLLQPLNIHDGTWYIDVGLELSQQGLAYIWRSDGHRHILANMLPLALNRATSATDPNSWGYQQDLSAHLMDLSGCRVDLRGGERGQNLVEYVQLYTTDKATTYHLERGRHSKHMTGTMALDGNPPRFIESLYGVFQNACQSIDVAARIEFRVPLAAARQVLLGMDNAAMSQGLVVLPRVDWW
jgi:hypothetical protein